MRLNLDTLDDARQYRLADGQPLPPVQDRTPPSTGAEFLGHLYRDHAARLRRFFRSRTASAHADDLVQEVFVRVAGAHARHAGTIEQPRAYLNRVATNLLREQARFAARRAAALHVSDYDVQLAGADPVAQLEARDMLARLETAMKKMKPATREIFMAHRIYGYSYSEIAVLHSRSTKSVEKHMAKAIFLVNRALRNC